MGEFASSSHVAVMSAVAPSERAGAAADAPALRPAGPIGLAGCRRTAALLDHETREDRALADGGADDFFRACPPLVLLSVHPIPAWPSPASASAAVPRICCAFVLNSASYYARSPAWDRERRPRARTRPGAPRLTAARPSLRHAARRRRAETVLPDLLSTTVELIKLTTPWHRDLRARIFPLTRRHLARSLTYNTSPLVLAG
jgi:polar amino acid transport system permease protein